MATRTDAASRNYYVSLTGRYGEKIRINKIKVVAVTEDKTGVTKIYFDNGSSFDVIEKADEVVELLCPSPKPKEEKKNA